MELMSYVGLPASSFSAESGELSASLPMKIVNYNGVCIVKFTITHLKIRVRITTCSKFTVLFSVLLSYDSVVVDVSSGGSVVSHCLS